MKLLQFSCYTALFLFAFGLTSAQAQEVGAAVQPEADREALDELRREYVELYNEGDIDGIVELFSEDALYYDPRGRSHEGRDALREHYQGLRDDGFTRVDLETIETEVWRDNAYAIGRYTLTNGEAEPLDGYYMTLFMRDGEDWRIHRLVVNMTAPEEADAAWEENIE